MAFLRVLALAVVLLSSAHSGVVAAEPGQKISAWARKHLRGCGSEGCQGSSTNLRSILTWGWGNFGNADGQDYGNRRTYWSGHFDDGYGTRWPYTGVQVTSRSSSSSTSTSGSTGFATPKVTVSGWTVLPTPTPASPAPAPVPWKPTPSGIFTTTVGSSSQSVSATSSSSFSRSHSASASTSKEPVVDFIPDPVVLPFAGVSVGSSSSSKSTSVAGGR